MITLYQCFSVSLFVVTHLCREFGNRKYDSSLEISTKMTAGILPRIVLHCQSKHVGLGVGSIISVGGWDRGQSVCGGRSGVNQCVGVGMGSISVSWGGASYQFCRPVPEHGKLLHLFKSIKYSIQPLSVQAGPFFRHMHSCFSLAAFSWSDFLHSPVAFRVLISPGNGEVSGYTDAWLLVSESAFPPI